VNISFFSRLKDDKSRPTVYLFYSAWALLVATVFCYGIFSIRIYFQNQKISELDKQINDYGTREEKLAEKEILGYKKKITDFSTLVDNHKISSNVFNFIEEKTLPNVMFSSINLSEVAGTIDVSGNSESMDTLSSQVHIFEENKDTVKSINVLSSQVADNGQVRFTMSLSLDPKIFAYSQANAIVSPETSVDSSNTASSLASLESLPYTNDKEGFSINAPKAWNVDESGKLGTSVVFLNTKPDKEGANVFDANINVISGPTKGLDLNNYINGQKKGLPKLFNDYKLVEDRTVDVHGMQGHILGNTFTQGVFQLRDLQLIVVKDGKAYIITGTALESTWDTYKDLMESSLLTFTLP